MGVNHNVSLVSFYEGKTECHDIIEPIVIGYSRLTVLLNKITSLFKKTHLKSFWELKLSIPHLRKLKRYMREINPDMILLKEFQSLSELAVLLVARNFRKNLPPPNPSPLGRGAGGRGKGKVILLIQARKNTLLGSESLFKLYLKLLSYLGVVYFVTPTQEGEEVLKSAGVMNVSYVPFVIDVNENMNSTSGDSRKARGTRCVNSHFHPISILSVGKFVPRKDHLTLLRAMNLLKSKYPIELTLVGERADEEYFQEVSSYIKKEYLESLVNVKFNLDYKEGLDEYKNHDLFVLPSYREPAAYCLVEAMASGLPVICSDDCGTRCYVREGENGCIFRHKDHKDLAEKIESIIKDRSKLVKMGQKSFQIAKTDHSLEFFNSEFSKILS